MFGHRSSVTQSWKILLSVVVFSSLSFRCEAAGYARLPLARVLRRLTLHFLPPVYSKHRLCSPQVPQLGSAQLGSARGLVGGTDTKNSSDGRIEAEGG